MPSTGLNYVRTIQCEAYGAIPTSSRALIAQRQKQNKTAIAEAISDCHAAGGGTVSLETPGQYYASDGIAIPSGVTLFLGDGVELIPEERILLSGTRVALIGDGSAKVSMHRSKRYTVTALSVVGNVATATIPGHPFIVGDAIALQSTSGITTSLENTSKTIIAIDGDDVLFAHTSADSEATIPYERIDGWNRGDYAIYPTAQLLRTSGDHALWIENATNWDVRGVEIDGARSSGIYMNNALRGRIRSVKVHGTAADGIHFTNRSANIVLDEAEVYDTGDDGIALIGYRGHVGPLQNIRIGKAHIHDLMYGGRGLTLAGSEGFRCDELLAENIYGAGVLVIADSTYRTLGNRDARFGSVTLHTCGSAGAEVTGWSTAQYAAMQLAGNNNDLERAENIFIEEYTCINARNYAISDSNVANGVRGVKIGTMLVEGGMRGPSNVLAPDSWTFGTIATKYTAQKGFLIGGANARGRTKIGNLQLRHFQSSQTRKYVTAISCADGTVTINAPGHGFTGQPTIWVSQVWSDATNATADIERTLQLADEALGTYYSYTGATSAWAANTAKALVATVIPTTANGRRYICIAAGTTHATTEPTWPTTVGATVTDGTVTWKCYGVAYTNSDAFTADADVITLEGTMLDDSNSPRIYTPRGRPSPNTYINQPENGTNDALQIGAFPAGSHLQVDEVAVLEQQFVFDDLVLDGSGGNATVTTSVDLSGMAAE